MSTSGPAPPERVPGTHWLEEALGETSSNTQGIQKPQLACSRVGAENAGEELKQSN